VNGGRTTNAHSRNVEIVDFDEAETANGQTLFTDGPVGRRADGRLALAVV
jgi:hypothetical protein